MQKMIPKDMGVSTAAMYVTTNIAIATTPYLSPRLRLLRDWLHMHPATKRNVHEMLALHMS